MLQVDCYFDELLTKAKSYTLQQLMLQEKQTRSERVKRAFMDAKKGSDYKMLEYYAQLYLNENVSEANQALFDIFTTTDEDKRKDTLLHDKWSLVVNPFLIRLYYYFGTKGSNQLEPRVEKALLDLLWERMSSKNDIALAKKSTWHMTGSENHDLNFKVCSLVSSQIFMELDEYKERTYPDLGCGGGSGYWFHYMYPFMGGDENDGFGPEGRAQLKDGEKYNANDHYEAWVEFFKEYFSQRAKKGFFVEASSSGYMKWTLSFISIILEFCNDEELRKMCKDFYDLIWCEWAQDQIKGRRGGAKTRFHFSRESAENDAMYYMAKFWFGGDGIAVNAYYFQMLSGYELPEIVWDLVINKNELGCYEYYSRRPGEEENYYPRPFGEERTLLCDTESRMLHYSYVTPEYILGTQMDHPFMIHSHLSCGGRWNGLIMGSSPNAYLYPSAFEEDQNGCLQPKGRMYRSVQKKDVLICAQHRGFFQISPEWFPNVPTGTCLYGFYLGKNFEVIEREKDYIFIYEEGTYAAIRPAYGGYREYKENIIIFNDSYAPAIIHTGRKCEYSSFNEFKRKIRLNSLIINNTVVPKFYTVSYKTDGDTFYFNAANNEPPKINGELIDYCYPYAFKSPFIEGKYNDGEITIKKDENILKLNFRR